MTDRPIIFSAPMVRAILAGRKTQTRRILKPKRSVTISETVPTGRKYGLGEWREVPLDKLVVPYAVGDRLWMREAFSYDRLDVDKDGTLPPWYWADGNPSGGDWSKPKPSIHMPRWASRITLEVTGFKVERLQDISEEDAKAEGITPLPSGRYFCGFDEDGEITAKSPVTAFGWVWNSIHGPDGWAVNPWVAAITFKRVS